MFSKFKLKLAKKHDAKRIAKLFSEIDNKIQKKDILGLIKDRKIFVLKRKKRIKAAFSYVIFGIIGFSVMYIKKLAVAKEWRKKGMGSLLISKIKWFARKMGLTAFFLFSLEKAKRFYEKNKLRHFWRFFWWMKSDEKNLKSTS